MDTKKDIYNLWIQYTTKSDEVFFRQFVRGFVAIWRDQLNLELEKMPAPSEIKSDSGPHIKRLPEELLPAIQKFLIIAKSDGEKRILRDDEISDTTLLFECLTIICRHFDNIPQVARSNFVPVGVEVISGVLNSVNRERNELPKAIRGLVKTFSSFVEVIFDPFLTWRHFVNTDLYEISHHPNTQLNSEIIPFIYGCFEDGTLTSDSLNILGGIIGGSQINAQRAVCPATVKIIVSLISTWECETNLRLVALKCFNLMVIVLLKASPETRQIELTTVMQQYHESIVLLLKTKHFMRKFQGEAFDITDEVDSCIDVSALHALIDNLRSLLQEPTVRMNVCKIMIDNNILNILIGVPNIIVSWDVDRQSLMATCVRVLRHICWASHHQMRRLSIEKLFQGLRLCGKPSRDLVAELIALTDALDDELFINCDVMREIIAWLGDFGEKEQQFAMKRLLTICTMNVNRKILACESRIVEAICESLKRFQRLSPETICDMTKVVEKLGKYTIHPIEVKKLFQLLREDFKFTYRFELLEAMVNISSHCSGNHAENRHFFNIQKNDEGITVPDIELWQSANPPSGFVFHTSINLERFPSDANVESPDELSAKAYRRQLLCLLSSQGTGFEVFVSHSGSLTLAAITKKEYHTVSANEAKLCDGQWHAITVSVVPSKRPFSYFQITMYRDQDILLSTSLKIGSHHEKFVYCTIGAPVSRVQETPVADVEDARDNSNTMKGLFPSLFEKAVTQAPNYFTLPLKGFSSQDPSTKCIALGLQESVFGSQICLRGQMGCVLLAESNYQLKNAVEAGGRIASVVSQDSESHDGATSKVVFCFSPSACCDSVCVDLSLGKKFTGHTVAKFHHVITIQDAVKSIGGIEVFFPLLECFRESLDTSAEESEKSLCESPCDTKNLKNPIAYLLILLRYYTNCESLQDNYESVGLIGSLVAQCDATLLDVHVLMALQIFIETVQQKYKSANNVPLLEALHEHLLFNFRIWSKASFQIIIGHTQYLQTLVKTDRKYFRKKYGIQFIFDTIRLYFITPNNIPLDDAKSIRMALLDITKYYIQKEINVKEVNVLLSFLATGKNEVVSIEVIDLLVNHMDANCKDQIFLLMLEPQTAELLYCMLLERTFSVELHNAVLKLIWCLLKTKWVSQRHKNYLILQDKSVQGQSLYPGLLTYLFPVRLEDEILVSLADQMLSSNSESGYCGIVYLMNNLQYRDLSLKLEISKKLISTVFTKQNSPGLIAQQRGWQQAIMKLLVKKSIKMDMKSSEVDFISFDDKTPVESREFPFEENFSLSEAADAMEVFDNDNLSLNSMSTVSEVNSLASPTPTGRVPSDPPSTISTVLPEMENTVSDEEQLVYLLTNIIFTILWRGIPDKKESWKARGEIIASVNLLALTNELFCSHLILRLRLLEMTVQACLIEIGEGSAQNMELQQYCAQLLRMVYDLVVLDQNKDDLKKCSAKLLDGVLALLDALMVFQSSAVDDWLEMKRVCLGLLIQCSHSSDPAIVAMATAKLHYILQSRTLTDLEEVSYLVFRLSGALENAIEVGNPEEYSFLIPVMKALLEKTETMLGLSVNVPDLPSLTSGPAFFEEFQMFAGHKQWRNFIKKRIEPLHDAYQKEIEVTLCEPLNTFWAECYESCKTTGKLCKEIEMESRTRFQEKIILPWRHRQSDEIHRQNSLAASTKAEESQCDRLYREFRRSLYGPRGPWSQSVPKEDHWKLLNRENFSRMRMKLEPNLYHNPHTMAASLRDNTTLDDDRRLSADFGSAIIPSAKPLDITDEEGFVVLEEDFRFSQEVSISEESQAQEVDKEKIIVSYECELIALMSRVKGKLELSATSVAFVDQSSQQQQDMKHDFKFPLALLREIHLRKYNLRRSALEMFLVDQRSYFINLTTKTRNKVFSKILGLQPPNIQYGSGRAPSELLKASGLTQKWVNREITNFDYLMHLNTIAGRTHNDLSQYPIFPWILADYTSEILDLTNPKSFRDLSKPIGVVNPKNEAGVRSKFENFVDPSGVTPNFHYGTHYSNSAGVLQYLIRLEPFTTLHVELQSGRFDVADRQFHSIAQTWRQLMDSLNDVKELIPEFFYMPDFLRNINGLDLGVLQTTQERVGDVILPPWADSPESFIAIHRRALESEYVSANLHRWIDLIFGCKQKGKGAIEALNVFQYYSYEGAVDLDKISDAKEREAIEGIINNFGQTPSQLLREPHPRRLTSEECLVRLLKHDVKRPDFMNYLDRVSSVYCDMSTEKDPVVYLSVPRTPQRSFLQIGPDVLISVTRSGVLSTHTWVSYDKEKGFVFGTDSVKSRKTLSAAFHPAVKLSAKLFALNVEGKLLYVGGIWDCSLKVFSVHKGRAVASVVAHSDVITCLAVDASGMHLVTGSRDCTCVLWSISNTNLTQSSVGLVSLTTVAGVAASGGAAGAGNLLAPLPLKALHGHESAISAVAIMTEFDVVASGSLDGTVNLYSIESGQLIRTVSPLGCTGVNIEISFVTISYQGHVAFSALDDTSYSVHAFTVNGINVGSKYVSGRVTSLATINDLLVVSDDAGDITISRLNGLKPIFDIPLHIPIETLVVVPGNSHLLAPLRDGNLAVVGVMLPNSSASGASGMPSARKHSILTV
ncbi:neurobeachin-like protein 1 [Phlebotomus argentipes]|uniref:neurobeachin-like protein 1 n=1 Tax=Phlebotomus argentipes TaxID=94469 RepID=UPI0028936BB6|nr:neurobeachin-like protein 1 [Phlebotomus argentipes]